MHTARIRMRTRIAIPNLPEPLLIISVAAFGLKYTHILISKTIHEQQKRERTRRATDRQRGRENVEVKRNENRVQVESNTQL